MKNIALQIIVSILLCNVVFAQDKLDGCWGLKFGMGQDSIVRIVKSRLSITPSTINKEMIIYKNTTLGTDKADVIKIYFQDGEFYHLDAFFFPEDLRQIPGIYESVKDAISNQYYQPQISVQSAIKGDPSTIGAIWNFPHSETTDINGEILLSIKEKKYIQLSYLDGERNKRVKKMTGKSAPADY